METARSTPGIMAEYGDPTVGEFLIVDENIAELGSTIVADIHDCSGRRRWVIYDFDSDCLLNTRTYDTLPGCRRRRLSGQRRADPASHDSRYLWIGHCEDLKYCTLRTDSNKHQNQLLKSIMAAKDNDEGNATMPQI